MSSQLNLASLSEPVKRSKDNLSSQGQTSLRQSGALSTEISLDKLRVNDHVLIRTAHSAYTFRILDPAKHLGLVEGGVFGNYAVKAFLEVAPITRDQRLKPGVRVCFYTSSFLGYQRVITSSITSLFHRRAGTVSEGNL